MVDDSIGSDVPVDVPSDVPVGIPVKPDMVVGDLDDESSDEVFDDVIPDNDELWEKIRLEQPDKKIPNSFFDRNKLLFLSCFDKWPRIKWLFKRLQFLNIFFALVGFYLLVCFLFPILLQLGYASACDDLGLDYVMRYHKCFDPIELEFGYNPHPVVSKYDVLFQTISLDYGKRLDDDISDGNLLREVERSRLEDESCDRSPYEIFSEFSLDDVVVKEEDNVSVPIVNISDGDVSE